ncbi:MAG: putative O-methyltransferase [Bacteroidetes bacterium ADurb.Bin408]|nr:MAG: putative O-methyltransferase [Bacteroidetes bacterium ADurb.Bin408]
MDFIPEEIEDYCGLHSTPETPLLAALNRETHAKYLWSRMLSGHQQGMHLQMISQMIKPEHILEIGTYTGYSAICLAKGLREGGRLTTIEKNPELQDVIMRYISQSENSKNITLLTGDACEILPTLNDIYDLVFIDADKENYITYFDTIINKVKTGGFILADNVLWDGKVLNPAPNDREALALAAFNKHVSSCPLVEVLMLPLRDGLSVIRKK